METIINIPKITIKNQPNLRKYLLNKNQNPCKEALTWLKNKSTKRALNDCNNICWIHWYIATKLGYKTRQKFFGFFESKYSLMITDSGVYGKMFPLHKEFFRLKEYKKLLKEVKSCIKIVD